MASKLDEILGRLKRHQTPDRLVPTHDDADADPHNHHHSHNHHHHDAGLHDAAHPSGDPGSRLTPRLSPTGSGSSSCAPCEGSFDEDHCRDEEEEEEENEEDDAAARRTRRRRRRRRRGEGGEEESDNNNKESDGCGSDCERSAGCDDEDAVTTIGGSLTLRRQPEAQEEPRHSGPDQSRTQM